MLFVFQDKSQKNKKNIISGSSAVEPASNGRAGLFALTYTLVTNFVGSFLGVLLAVTVKPGKKSGKKNMDK